MPGSVPEVPPAELPCSADLFGVRSEPTDYLIPRADLAPLVKSIVELSVRR